MTAPDGRHLAFPFRVGPDGRSVTVQTLAEHVRDEIVQLILTNQGERAFLPEFGGGARRLVFEGTSEATQAMARAMLSQALDTWLANRVAVEELEVTLENARIDVDLRYRVAGDSDARRLRFQRDG